MHSVWIVVHVESRQLIDVDDERRDSLLHHYGTPKHVCNGDEDSPSITVTISE
ncbi:hypothetical protein M404DRAFT_1006161 [Pisolithus tinctorius Marx 270]|uniref:Uncharacterized protein n=1 Tax=Pisolithus tinctorius Marx 270 TaxID=870435 RepID=A0A0C3IJZ9_PISTI|nr:hypothetical protein M404DRAFT_1006161 [Pisolithus tinctorius Marx 270]